MEQYIGLEYLWKKRTSVWLTVAARCWRGVGRSHSRSFWRGRSGIFRRRRRWRYGDMLFNCHPGFSGRAWADLVW